MKKLIVTIMAIVCMGMTAFAHHGGFWGRGGCNFWPGFIGGAIGAAVGTAVANPAPVVYTTPVVTTPVVATTVPVATTTVVTPSYSYGYYNNVYCPTYGGYYYYGNTWVWGGGFGPRPPIPAWHPAPHHGGPHGGPGGHGGPHGGPGGHH